MPKPAFDPNLPVDKPAFDPTQGFTTPESQAAKQAVAPQPLQPAENQDKQSYYQKLMSNPTAKAGLDEGTEMGMGMGQAPLVGEGLSSLFKAGMGAAKAVGSAGSGALSALIGKVSPTAGVALRAAKALPSSAAAAPSLEDSFGTWAKPSGGLAPKPQLDPEDVLGENQIGAEPPIPQQPEKPIELGPTPPSSNASQWVDPDLSKVMSGGEGGSAPTTQSLGQGLSSDKAQQMIANQAKNKGWDFPVRKLRSDIVQ